MPAAGPFVTAATMSEMSAAHKAFWLPLSQQSETASDVNCEIQANDEMMFLGGPNQSIFFQTNFQPRMTSPGVAGNKQANLRN